MTMTFIIGVADFATAAGAVTALAIEGAVGTTAVAAAVTAGANVVAAIDACDGN